MKSFLALILPLLLLAGTPQPEVRIPDVPVIDLRVGLARDAAPGVSLEQGQRQAGYLELARGHVIGAVLPFGSRDQEQKNATAAFLTLRAALDSSQRFELRGCSGRSGRIATWLALQAPAELAADPNVVGLWVTRGVRIFAIGSAYDNELVTAASGLAPGPLTGLTAAGRRVVQAIIAGGALVDVSDASELGIDETIALAQSAHAAVIATHSNARALADNPSNLSDTQIRQIAGTGGLIGVTAEHGRLAPGRSANLQHLVRQIKYLVRVAGAEHVALGIGFENGVSPVVDFRSAEDFPRLAATLAKAGLDRDDIARIFYENAQRLLCPPRATLKP
ncbi:MAG TPA: membrane dipeptidase [Polyangiales bacterium]|jgi:membrane dipeptidase